MIEQYAFIVENSTMTFSTLKSNGMFVKDITDSGAVSWNIATSKSPFQDGEKINNRTANNREITITFGYDLTTKPEIADNTLFAFLSSALTSNGSLITLKKISNGVTKYIDGYISNVEHIAYTEEPQLLISIITNSYWRGNAVTVDLMENCTKSGNYYYFDTFSVNNEVMADVTYELQINRNDAELTAQNMTFYLYDYSLTGLPDILDRKCHMGGFTDVTLPRVYEDMAPDKLYEYYLRYIAEKGAVSAEAELDIGRTQGLQLYTEKTFVNVANKLETPLVNPADLTCELITKLKNGTYDGKRCFKVSSGIETLLTSYYEDAMLQQVPYARLLLKYTPLFIR